MTDQEAIAIHGRCETCGRAATHTHNPEYLEMFRQVERERLVAQVHLWQHHKAIAPTPYASQKLMQAERDLAEFDAKHPRTIP